MDYCLKRLAHQAVAGGAVLGGAPRSSSAPAAQPSQAAVAPGLASNFS